MKKSEATAVGGVPQNAGKSEITNQELLQAIQNIDQKLESRFQTFDQKLVSQKDEILVAMDQKLEDQKNEILDAILKTAELDEQRFQKIETSLSGIANRLGDVENRLSGVEGTINTQMVTKDYLDKKFAEFGVEHNYKHKRVDKLTNILHKKKILNVAETQIVLARLA